MSEPKQHQRSQPEEPLPEWLYLQTNDYYIKVRSTPEAVSYLRKGLDMLAEEKGLDAKKGIVESVIKVQNRMLRESLKIIVGQSSDGAPMCQCGHAEVVHVERHDSCLVLGCECSKFNEQ